MGSSIEDAHSLSSGASVIGRDAPVLDSVK